MSAQLDIFTHPQGHAYGVTSGRYISKHPAIPGEWVRMKDHPNILGCPRCGRKGSWWFGGPHFADRGAQALWDRTQDIFAQTEDGNILRDHWSRIGFGQCAGCELQYAHDFGGNVWSKRRHRGDWWYYHEPLEVSE